MRSLTLALWLLLVVAIVLSWLLLPSVSGLVPQRAANLRGDIETAIEEERDPAERIRLQLEFIQVQQDDDARRSELRSGIAQLSGGVVLLIGAITAWRQLQVSRRQVESNLQATHQELRRSREELDLMRRGQITDSFSQAVQQLGNHNLDVRLGGMFALERIARDSASDRSVIKEILAAFVRGHGAWPPDADDPWGEDVALEELPLLRSRKADIEIALTILGRLPASDDGSSINLSSIDLRRARLDKSDFAGAQLYDSNLSRAAFRDANLEGANLSNAILIGALLQRANLHSASLTSANLTDADLRKIDLTGAHLRRVDMTRALLQYANLKGARMHLSNLTDAHLRGCNLSKTRLEDANLEDADLRYAKLVDVDLRAANLRGARLYKADLSGSHLHRADLTNAQIEGVIWDGVEASGDTQWPRGVDPSDIGIVIER